MNWFRLSSCRFSSRRSKILALAIVVGAVFVLPRGWLYWQISSARTALLKGKPAAAVERMARAVAFAPNHAEAQYLLAVALRRAGHLDQVSAPLEAARKLGWSREDLELQSLLTLVQNGEIDTVDARLKAIMARGASDEAAEQIYEAYAIGYLKTYRLKEAWDCLNYWGTWQPKAIFPKFWRADICRRIDNAVAEEQEYRDILAIDPHHLESRVRLADVLKDSNRVQDAAREYELSLAQDSSRPEILIGLAECERRLGHVPRAVALLKQAMELKLSATQRSTALTQSGQIDADEGNWRRAIEQLEEAVNLAPSEGSTLFALSQAYSAAGEELKSQEALTRSKLVKKHRDRIEEIARILVDRPASADLRFEAGKILMDLGMKEDGAAWLQTALLMRPDHAAALEALAQFEREKSAGTIDLPQGPRNESKESTRMIQQK